MPNSLLAISLMLALSPLALNAEQPARIPIRDFFDNPKISSASISPDGQRFAFLAPEKNRMNVWVGNVGEPMENAKLVTHDQERGIMHFAWTRDGKYIVYSQDRGGDENFHLFRVDPSQADQGAVNLTPLEGARAQVIDLPRDRPDEVLVALNARDKRVFDAYRLSLSSGKLELIEENPGDVEGWFTDRDGLIRATTSKKGTQTEIRVRDSGEGEFRLLATYEHDESPSIHGFKPDGKSLYFSSARGSNTERLVTLDLKTGKETVLDSDPQYDLGGVLISDITGQLLGASYDKERLVYKSFDPQFTKDLEILEKLHEGEVHLRSSSADEQKWIVAYNSPTDPGATYLYDRATGKAEFLYRPRPWLPRESLTAMEPISFPSRDGLTLHGYLTLPKGVEPRNLPTVVIVHGGPWARDSWGYDPEAQFLSNRGYAVLQINFRGSTGYGKEFLNAGDKEWGGKMLDDIIDGAEWIVAKGIADKKRLAIYGGSYGGYATLAALAFRPGVFACGVNYVGVSNLLTFMNTIPPYWDNFREVMYQRIGHPEKDKEFLRSRSPLFAADKINVPLFVAQGFNDPRVNHAEAEQIVEAVKANKKPVEYLVKMDEGHGFQNPENRIEFYEKMEAFLEKHLR